MSWDMRLERLRGRTLFVGTPMYAGQCCSQFAFAIAQLAALCTQVGVQLRFHFSCNDALVTKARNATVARFLASGDGHLLFVDADIGFDPRDVLYLLGLQALGEGFDVVAAPYPAKRIAWDSVLRAAQAGYADADPELLARFAGPVAIAPLADSALVAGEPVEVSQAGTGCMMIARATFERVRAALAPSTYAEEGTPGEIAAFFETRIAGGRYISEDYAFCHAVRAAGMRVWLCPWMELSHTGSHTWTSRLTELARIGEV